MLVSYRAELYHEPIQRPIYRFQNSEVRLNKARHPYETCHGHMYSGETDYRLQHRAYTHFKRQYWKAEIPGLKCRVEKAENEANLVPNAQPPYSNSKASLFTSVYTPAHMNPPMLK